MKENNQEPLEERVQEKTPIKSLFGKRPWRDTGLYSINENGYYVSEKHPIAAKVLNTYLKSARWLLGVNMKANND